MGQRPGILSTHRGGLFLALCLLLAALARGAPAQGKGTALLWPSAIAYDTAGNLYIADSGRHQVFEATLAGTLLVVAGSGTQGFAGDGGPAKVAQLNGPQGIAVAADGTIYIADTGNARIRAVAGGTITTLAGTGRHVFGGDGGAAANASFRAPAALALDGKGGLLLCDPPDHRVRRVDLEAGGAISTVAGTGVQGYAGDGGVAAAAEMNSPEGVAVAGDGRVFVADTHNQRIRVVSVAGLITTFAGDGTRGSEGDGGLAVSAQLTEPRGLLLAEDGVLYIGDAGNRRVRQVSTDGIMATLAGSGVEGAGADGDALATTSFRTTRALALSSFGLPVVADTLNSTVRVLTAGGTVFQPAALAAGRAGSGIVAAMSSPQVYGSLSAAVSVSGPVGTPRGTVSMVEAGSTPGSTLGSASLQNGDAKIAGAVLSTGSHTVLATYGGDGLNGAASSSTLPLLVTPLAITAVADSASAVYGAPTPALTGSLQGVLSADAGKVAAVFSAGAAALAPVGSYPISATLTGSSSGDYLVSMAAGSGSFQVTPAGSTTLLATVPAGYAGLPLRLTVHVASDTRGQPSGTVQFLDNGTVVATVTLVNGSASGIEVAPSSGAHSLSAAYAGDANFSPSSSASQSAAVGALPDFAISLGNGGSGNGSSATISAGSSAAYQVVVGASPAPFTGDVTLAVSGLPVRATATFSPVQVVPGTGSATVTLSVQTPAAQALLPANRQPGVWLAGICLLGGFGVARTRRFRTALSLAVVCFVLTGCGARTVGEGTGTLTSKTYSLQITGTSTNLLGAVVTHSTGTTLIVQQ